jgi:hypothetical protein
MPWSGYLGEVEWSEARLPWKPSHDPSTRFVCDVPAACLVYLDKLLENTRLNVAFALAYIFPAHW